MSVSKKSLFCLVAYVIVTLLILVWSTWPVRLEATRETFPSSQRPFTVTAPLREKYYTRQTNILRLGKVINSREVKQELANQSKQQEMAGIEEQTLSELSSTDVGPPSDSDCALPNPTAPTNLGRLGLVWVCNLSQTFVVHNRQQRKLDISCEGNFSVNFVDRDAYEVPLSNGRHVKDEVWEEYTGPAAIPFNTQYVDVVCNNQHNYRTQLVPNLEGEATQRKIYNTVKKNEPDYEPLSILSLSVDSLSRAQMFRPFGLPKTAALLKKLYYSSDVNSDSTGKARSHRAFLFNRVNALGGGTAMNLVPMYGGTAFTEHDERERVKHHTVGVPVKEWVWQYAAKRGYITSYAVDVQKGLFGTKLNCSECHYRHPSIPHWEHGWYRKENTAMGDGILSGFCDGDAMVFDYIMNYSRQVLQRDHPAKWVAFDMSPHHRPEADSVHQADHSLSLFLETVLSENENLVVFLFGDHGKPYFKFLDNVGGHYETFLPFFSILLPSRVLKKNPEFGNNLLKNSKRLISYYDVHTTSKSLMHYPHLKKVGGHLTRQGKNLLTQVLSPNRSCYDARISSWACTCNVLRELPRKEWGTFIKAIVDEAISTINQQHKTREIVSSGNKTTCRDVRLQKISSAFKKDVVNKTPIYMSYRRIMTRSINYIIQFTVVENSAKFEVVGHSKKIVSIKQMSRYAKYAECHDKRVSIQFCICKTFPDDIP